ncbi:MAG: type II toxin-antitoxin system VapC family toxin [Alphaproteobacteria bacterium]
MTLVVDASVACKWVLAEQGSGQARKLVESGEQLIAPAVLLVETANVFRRRLRLGEISEVQARHALTDVRAVIYYLEPVETLIDAAFDLSITMNHPVYDCLYLALAQQQDCEMVTADKKLASRATALKLGKFVRLLTA